MAIEALLSPSVGISSLFQLVNPSFSSVQFSRLGFLSGSVVKNPPANAGDTRDVDSIPGSGRSPGRGHGNSLQYSFFFFLILFYF